MIPQVKSMFDAFANNYGLEQIFTDQENSGVITISDFNIYVGLLESRGLVVFQAPIGVAPSTDNAEFFRQLLIANNLFSSTSGATLGMEEYTNLVTIQFASPFERLTYDTLEIIIQNILILATEWIDRINLLEQEEATKTKASSYPSPTQNMIEI